MKKTTTKQRYFLLSLLLFFSFQVFSAVHIVTNGGDGAASTFRNLVDLADPGDTIRFSSILNGTPITLINGEIVISKRLTIIGNGIDVTIIGAANNSRVFRISSTDSVDIHLMTINNGFHPFEGGAIKISGTPLELNRLKIESSTAGLLGGAIYNEGGNLTLRQCSILNNEAQGVAFDQGGGGIYHENGLLFINNNSEINLNKATGASGSGGGIFIGPSGSFTLLNSTVAHNEASRAGGGIEINDAGMPGDIRFTNVVISQNTTRANPGNGGGLHITGNANLRLNRCTVSGNLASSEGGGIWNGTGLMTLDSVSITGNTANGHAADHGGGGIFNAGGRIFILNNTNIQGNAADGTLGSGGGIFNDVGGSFEITNSSVIGNTANRAGGGIESISNEVVPVKALASSISLNQALSNPGNGGGIHHSGTGVMIFENCTLQNNTAATNGGGIWNGTGRTSLVSTTLQSNSAQGDAANNGGGGIFNAGGKIVARVNTQISGNMATGTSGSGGGIFNDVGGELVLNTSSVNGNSANRAGGGIEDNSGASSGIRLTNIDLNNNTASSNPGNGGGLHITGNGGAKIRNCDIFGNTAASEGGGLWNGTGLMTINGGDIQNNTALGNNATNGGGGIFNAGGSLRIQNSVTVSNNSATGTNGNGGGIFNDAGGSASIRDSEISDNTASKQGGGIWNGSGSLVVNQSKIDNNEAQGGSSFDGGGGIYNSTGIVRVTRASVTHNGAIGESANGGGLHNANGTANIIHCTISSNTAGANGGGIFNNASCDATFSTIAMNSASSGGGISTSSSAISTTVRSSIAALNVASVGIDMGNISNSYVSNGYNVIGQDDMGVFPEMTTDQEGTIATPIDPLLGALSTVGGSLTEVHPITGCGSPAVDMGPNSNSTDQLHQPIVGQKDVGAFEFQTACPPMPKQGGNAAARTSFHSVENLTIYPNPVKDGLVSIQIPTFYGEMATVRAIDQQGKIAALRNVQTGMSSLNLPELPNGIYSLQVVSENTIGTVLLQVLR